MIDEKNVHVIDEAAEAKVVENAQEAMNSIGEEEQGKADKPAPAVVEDTNAPLEYNLQKEDNTDTPMVAKFKKLKANHPDALLLFRCGDFYQTYFDDAKACSEILGITLTKRSGDSVEMAGFPYHALDTYLPKLIRTDRRVVIYVD